MSNEISEKGAERGITALVDGVRVFIDFPPGWEAYEPHTKRQWVEHQKLRLRSEKKKIAKVKHRADQERFTPPEIRSWTPPPYDVDPNRPRFVIRAVYGACAGTVFSRILILPHDERYLQRRVGAGGVAPHELERQGEEPAQLEGVFEGVYKAADDVVKTWGDGHFFDSRPVTGGLTDGSSRSPVWGPREFLWNLLDAAASVHGDAIVYLVHNNAQFQIDAVKFHEWIQKGLQEDPMQVLYEYPQLIEKPEEG